MAAKSAATRLTRALNAMPATVSQALEQRGLTEAYERRPAYQRNDYLGWIARARRAETQLKRLEQMLDELANGGFYMNMAWRPRVPVR